MSAPMIEVERLRTALREIEQATEGIPEQNCALANRIARLALLATAPLPTSQPARAIEVCKRAATAPAEGFFARGDDGQYHLDPAPSCPHGHPAGSARDCACHEEP